MGRIKTLNYQSDYNASTNTPLIADMVIGGIYKVTTQGAITATVKGAEKSSGSYLFVGDEIVYDGTDYKLLSQELKQAVTIPSTVYGTDFVDINDVNTYVHKRVLNYPLTVEIPNSNINASGKINIRNYSSNGVNYIIKGLGTNSKITMPNNQILYIQEHLTILGDLEITGDCSTELVYLYAGKLEMKGNLKINNTNATAGVGLGGFNSSLLCYDATKTLTMYGKSVCGPFQRAGNVYLLCNIVCLAGSTSGLHGGSSQNQFRGNITTNGSAINLGDSCSNYITGAINSGGGTVYMGSLCSNYITGAINSGGGTVYMGSLCSNYITGAINSDSLNCGDSSVSLFQSTVTTTNTINTGSLSTVRFISNVNCSGFICGIMTNTVFFGGTLNTNGWLIMNENSSLLSNTNISAPTPMTLSFSTNNKIHISGNVTNFSYSAGKQVDATFSGTAPTGTPATGTNTAAFRRA